MYDIKRILNENKYITAVSMLGIAILFCLDFFIKDKVEKEETQELQDKLDEVQGEKEYVTLTKYHNYGAFRNLGDKKPGTVKAVSIGLCIICTVVYIISLGAAGKKLLTTGLSILLGGAFSNTYDRMKRGYVVDYLRFKTPLKWIDNMIFNISDFFIIIGAVVSSFAS